MTPQELHKAIDARRLALGLAWWQVAVALDAPLSVIDRMKRGGLSPAVRQRAEAWLAMTSETAGT